MAIETCSPSKVHPFVSHSAAGTTVVRRRVVGPQRQSEALSLHAAGPEGLPVTCAASSSVALSGMAALLSSEGALWEQKVMPSSFPPLCSSFL
jgi:hypothetical protein